MRQVFAVLMFCAWTGGVLAEEKVTWNRNLTQFGVFATVAGNGDLNGTGWGFSIRPYCYLDPSKPEGLYVSFLSGTYSHSADGIALADTRLVGLGWRGNPLGGLGRAPLDLQADFGVAPTLGARISGNTILGSTYAGIGMTVGLYFPIMDWGDLGFSWEPTVNLTTFSSPDIPQKSYSDFVVYWVMKSYTKTVQLPWK